MTSLTHHHFLVYKGGPATLGPFLPRYTFGCHGCHVNWRLNFSNNLSLLWLIYRNFTANLLKAISFIFYSLRVRNSKLFVRVGLGIRAPTLIIHYFTPFTKWADFRAGCLFGRNSEIGCCYWGFLWVKILNQLLRTSESYVMKESLNCVVACSTLILCPFFSFCIMNLHYE